MPNLNFIREYGIEQFIEQQNKRIKFLETMIDNYNDGRSRSFYCRAAALLDLKDLKESLEKAIQKIRSDNIKPADTKTKARILRAILNEILNNLKT